MNVSEFDFDLPSALIAQEPADPRDDARLLHVSRCGLFDKCVRDLPERLRPGDALVVNDTRVIPARLRGRRGQAEVEITLHRQLPEGAWLAFARPAKRLRVGDRIAFARTMHADVLERREAGEVKLGFNLIGAPFWNGLSAIGEMPLPPYIKRPRGEDRRDLDRYQTMFGDRDGAVAAPTAGLHFTPGLVDRIRAAGVAIHSLTLHVGAGTFLPVKTDRVEDHKMHSETGAIDRETATALNDARGAGGRIVAVGTTVARLLETAAKGNGHIEAFHGSTDIFIYPGYAFRSVDLLITNFHLPRSTLFMLVCAFAGKERMSVAYDHAIHERYRFFSYGDACLLEPGP